METPPKNIKREQSCVVDIQKRIAARNGNHTNSRKEETDGDFPRPSQLLDWALLCKASRVLRDEKRHGGLRDGGPGVCVYKRERDRPQSAGVALPPISPSGPLSFYFPVSFSLSEPFCSCCCHRIVIVSSSSSSFTDFKQQHRHPSIALPPSSCFRHHLVFSFSYKEKEEKTTDFFSLLSLSASLTISDYTLQDGTN